MQKGAKPKLTKEEKEQILIEKTKKLSIKEGAAYSFMDGFGLRYISPYALAVGANNLQIGLLSSIPSLLGNLSQLFTFKAIKKYKRKNIIFWGVFLQSLMWLALLSAGIFYFIYNIKTTLPGYLVIIIYTLLILFGAFGGPAWTSLMRDIIKENRGSYFGKRNRIVGIIALICMLIAGFILDYFKDSKIFIGFIIIFSIAFFGRLISAILFKKHYEPKFKTNEKYYFSILEFIKKMKDNNFGRFVIYFSLIHLATAISGPFLAVYMLKDLSFSYTQFMAISLSASIMSFMFMPFWGKFTDTYGSIKTIKITSAAIPIIPFLWFISAWINPNLMPIFIYLFIIELFSGAIWAGFNLSIGTFIYDAVTKERLVICTSYLNIISGFCILIGASIGGLIASQNFNIFGITPILAVILLSGIIRTVVYFSMKKKIKEIREVKEFGIKEAKENLKSISFQRFAENFEMNKLKSRPH
ncbi:MAG: MFS transporter [archaeon]|nr:MFS transporter [archaeon]